jgi:hypothetical protein
MRSARRSINLMLLEWANRGINMWTMEERVVTLTQGVGEYQLDADIVDIIEQVVQQRYGVGSINACRFQFSERASFNCSVFTACSLQVIVVKRDENSVRSGMNICFDVSISKVHRMGERTQGVLWGRRCSATMRKCNGRGVV